MANICKTDITIHANQSTIDWFEKLIRNFTDSDYSDQFGNLEANNSIDKIGCKWIIKIDNYREDNITYFISFESAWYPPDILLKGMYSQLSELDSGAWLEGRWWEESFSSIGIFEINNTGYHEEETSVEVDFDDDDWWGNQVEPAFNDLEL